MARRSRSWSSTATRPARSCWSRRCGCLIPSARAGVRAAALRPVAGAPPRDANEVVHDAAAATNEAGFAIKAATITPEGARRRRLAQPDPARGGRRQGDHPHRAAHPGCRTRSPACTTRSASCGWRSRTPTAPSSGARASPERPDEVAFRTEKITRSTCRAVAEYAFRTARAHGRARLRRAEVDRLAGLRGDAQGGDGRRRGAPSRRRLPAGADRRDLRRADLRRGRRAAGDPGPEPRRRLPVATS